MKGASQIVVGITWHAWHQLRLGFHDCLKYDDGTGGCDGCLAWDGVGNRYGGTTGTYAAVDFNHNNGMAKAVEILEKVYTEPGFPSKARPLPASLQNLGKSRADLWALATIVAVEYTIDLNNAVCDNPDHETYITWNLQTNDGSGRHCNPLQGSSECKVNLNGPIKFRSGRVDCGISYKSTKKEVAPSGEGNGQATVNFFANNFGFTGRETAAILGAHTLGRLHHSHSLFRYVWVHAGGMMFNNQYYRNIVGKRDWRFDTGPHQNQCLKLGNAWRQKPAARWIPHVFGDKTSGGPVHWILEKLVYPKACLTNPSTEPCCTNVPAGALCHPDNNRAKGTDAALVDDDVNGGCEKYLFIPGHDEMALPAEIGLYYNFSIDSNNIPHGCPGFEQNNWNLAAWKTKGWTEKWSMIDGVRAAPKCPLNTYADSGDAPLHTILEEYADSQAAFIKDFVPALEKMLGNGYSALTVGLDQWSDVICSKTFSICFRLTELSNPFYIASDFDRLILKHSSQQGPKLVQIRQLDTSGNDPLQRWHWLSGSQYLINEGTHEPLVLGTDSEWIAKLAPPHWYTPKSGSKILSTAANQCISRSWTSGKEEDSVHTWNCWGGPVQYFSFTEATL